MIPRRAPQGARGLKFPGGLTVLPLALSRPARGAWIEINQALQQRREPLVAPRKGRVD